MKFNEQPRPTFEEFVALSRDAFGFLSEFSFTDAPLPQQEFVNQFQVRFTNGKVIVVVEGIHWGYGADVHLEDTAGVSVPLVLFVPREHREAQARRRPGEPDQCVQIRTAAERIREHCVDLLQGDMTRFYDRAAEWRRVTRPRAVTEAQRMERQRQQAVTAAGHASKRADYAEVVRLLQPYADVLSPHQRRLLEMARTKLGKGAG